MLCSQPWPSSVEKVLGTERKLGRDFRHNRLGEEGEIFYELDVTACENNSVYVSTCVTQHNSYEDYCFIFLPRSSSFPLHNVRSFCRHLKDIVIFGRSLATWLRR